MFAYLVSVSVRLLLAYAIGWPSCRRHAPSPLWEASRLYYDWFPSVIVSEWLGGTLGNQILELLEAGVRHFIPCEDRLLLEHCPEWFSMMAEMWHEVPHVCDHSNEAGQLLFIRGGGSSLLFPVFSSGRDACHQRCTPHKKSETLGRLSSNFLLFSTKPSIWATLRRFTRLASWSSSDTPYTTMSSWMLMTPGHRSMMRSIFIWKTSCDILAPKGIRLNLYLPLWVFITSNLLLSSVRCTCRKALRASAFVKTTAPASWCSDFLHCLGLVVLPDDGFVKVPRIQAWPYFPCRFDWISYWGYPWCRLYLWLQNVLFYHVVNGLLDCCLAFYWHLPPRMLYWWHCWVYLDVILSLERAKAYQNC